MHATWHALQPMHFVVSISFATVPACDSRTLGGGVVVAERRMMSRDCSGIAFSCSGLCLFHANEEGLELRRLRVGVADDRRQRVREVSRLRDAGEAPVDRDAYVMHRLAVDVERPDALGD